jgi:hypothetical protein
VASSVFVDGSVVERSFRFGDTTVGVLGDISISGRGLTIYTEGEGGGAASIGTGAVRTMFDPVAAEAEAEGFASLTVSGVRYSRANPGRVVTITRVLDAGVIDDT